MKPFSTVILQPKNLSSKINKNIHAIAEIQEEGLKKATKCFRYWKT